MPTKSKEYVIPKEYFKVRRIVAAQDWREEQQMALAIDQLIAAGYDKVFNKQWFDKGAFPKALKKGHIEKVRVTQETGPPSSSDEEWFDDDGSEEVRGG